MSWKIAQFCILALLVAACTEIEPKPYEPAIGHITKEEQAAPAGKIPELVTTAPVLPKPQAPAELEKYTVVVNEVPVKELLFALARDAKINVDIDPSINGVVTINAVDQTMPQILERISNQVDMRYEFRGDNLIIQQDTPYLKTYTVNYINLSRDAKNTNSVATSLATTGVNTGGGGGDGGGSSSAGAFGGNNSTTELTSESLNQFWASIVRDVSLILQEDVTGEESRSVIPNPESGLLSVFATAKQHAQIQKYLDLVQASIRRQVLIQVTIVEVNLNDQYRGGIDWRALSVGAFTIVSSTLGGTFGVITAAGVSKATGLVVDDPGEKNQITLQLLSEFGDVKVLSSPQLMALNNQTAILKRVENKVFFTIESNTLVSSTGPGAQSFDTTIHTLPVGIVMTITPYIAENGEITLLVRPTISRDTGVEREIPVPDTAGATTTIDGNVIPETVSQEMESLIRLNSGQVAILGGLMEDRSTLNDAGVPGTSRFGLIGNLFKTRDIEYHKTETVIFIRPILVNSPSIETDLQLYKPFLEETTSTAVPGTSEVNRP